MDVLEKFQELREEKGVEYNTFYRRPIGLYYALKDLYNDGKLTTWEMNEVDKLYRLYIKEESK